MTAQLTLKGGNMATKGDRLLSILYLLDRGAEVTTKTLSEDFGVSERGIYRYLSSLQEAGFPIYFDRDKGTYAFVDGFKLKKASLSADEVLALAMAKKVLTAFGKTFGNALESLEKKVLSISTSKSGFVPTSAFVLPSQGSVGSADMSALAKDLASAVIEHSLVLISYESLYSQEMTEREVEPYYIFFSPDGFWNLRAYCRLREDWRTFALDRVRSWKIWEKSFVPRLFGDDVGREVASGFGTYVDGELEEVVVQFSPEIRSYVERRVWHPSQENRSLDNGWLEVRFVTSGTEGLKYWLYRWTPHFKVVRPASLRQEIMEDLAKEKENLHAAL
jgi:predicted DNA-binding transcriptional regulator YafY